MKKLISSCLSDLNFTTNINNKNLQFMLQSTPKRKKDYLRLDNALKLQGVSDEDRIIILDGHDFACNCSKPIDFITFDDDCYNGAKNTNELCFSSVYGRFDDFKSS